MNTENTIAICFGEVLWDMLPDGPQLGGAPLNVAYQLNKLGLHSLMISKIGTDQKGSDLKVLMEKWGVSSLLLQEDKEQPTSEVIASMTDANEVKYDIVFPVAWDYIAIEPKLLEAVRNTKYFIFGSLAARHDVSRDTLLSLLAKTDAIKVLDVNFRPPFVKAEVLEGLLMAADVVKLNEEELRLIPGLFKEVYSDELKAVTFLQERFGIREVVVTKGAAGASYYKGAEVFHGAGKAVQVEDTIGSGDAFLAAFIAGHHSTLPGAEILQNAMSLGAFIATKKGGCPEYALTEYENFKHN